MAKYEEHWRESLQTFGRPFKEVHLWLDALAYTQKYGMRHRRVRHHEAGIQEAVRLFGEDAGKVARQHIIRDLKEEGWKEGNHFPQDEKDYVKMGLF